MSETNQCPECGAALPASAPRGLCPVCLLKRGLETNTVGYTADAPSANRWTPPTIEELAAKFPELEITQLIGRGGMGAVYQARQKNLDRVVALKILPPEMANDPAFAERFAREAQAMARLNHPHIVTLYEFGQRGGLYFFIMEFVDGVSLRGLLDTGHIAPKEALAIVPQICEALQYAHDQGIVHRDIKPENILLNKQGQVKIADFGLAKLVGHNFSGGPQGRASSASPTPEKIMGTPQYMAPEQIDHPADVDHRADIYSLGVVFYQMLTGELPVGRFAAPSKKVQIDVRLDEIVLRALEKEPEKRYQQVSQVKTQVETIAGILEYAAPSGSWPTSESTNTPAQFSRIALVGAAWAAFFFAVVPAFLAHEIQTHEFWDHGPFSSVLGTLVFFVFILPNFIAPVGITILGSMALVQIRHSKDRLYGLGMALFDALLFPVLFLDNAIAWAACGISLWLADTVGPPTFPLPPWNSHPAPVIWALLAIPTCMIVDALVLRWAWRAATKPLNGTRPKIPVSPQSGNRATMAFVFRSMILGILVVAVLFGGMLAVIWLNNHGRNRQHSNSAIEGQSVVQTQPPNIETLPDSSTTTFGSVIEHIITTNDADEDGVVFFNMKTGQTFKPPVRLQFYLNQASITPMTPQLREFIRKANVIQLIQQVYGPTGIVGRLGRGSDVDLLLHLTDKSWGMMNLEMQEDFIGQPTDFEKVTSKQVVDVFRKLDAGHLVRGEVPASSFGHGYRDGPLACQAFRTRTGAMGVYQIEGIDDVASRGVRIHYKFVQPANEPPSDAGPTVAGLPPVVVRTEPASGASDVAPGITDIRVTFSKEMADGSWSWSTAWEDSTPEIIGKPWYEADHRTAAIKVKLEPGQTYAFWLNSENFHNFQDTGGHPAVPYLLIFQTRENPTTKE